MYVVPHTHTHNGTIGANTSACKLVACLCTECHEVDVPDRGIASDTSGRTFTHIFGTQQSSLERLLLTCRIMGPCWLTIQNFKAAQPQHSWCRWEAGVPTLFSTDAAGNEVINIARAEQQPPPPKVCVMSLKIVTILNHATNTNEVASVTAVLHKASMFASQSCWWCIHAIVYQ
jgi:hypothetical protein